MFRIKAKKVLLGIGSNIDDRLTFIINALKNIEKFLKIEKISSIYESRSLKKDNQKNYYNVVIKVETWYNPSELLKNMKNIEAFLGRVKRERWGEREIDIDIIDYNGMAFKRDGLIIPHYDMHNRSFVLYPLLEIEPNYIHPILQKSVKDMIEELTDKLNIERIGGIQNGSYYNLT
jgi:2-amino-4-hydroxy-6-hydroxymethyldihydropteridine diphosphokinase